MNRVKMSVREWIDGGGFHNRVGYTEIDGAGGNTTSVQGSAVATSTTAPPDPSIVSGGLPRDVN